MKYFYDTNLFYNTQPLYVFQGDKTLDISKKKKQEKTKYFYDKMLDYELVFTTKILHTLNNYKQSKPASKANSEFDANAYDKQFDVCMKKEQEKIKQNAKTKSTQTIDYEFSVNDDHKQADSFIEKKQPTPKKIANDDLEIQTDLIEPIDSTDPIEPIDPIDSTDTTKSNIPIKISDDSIDGNILFKDNIDICDDYSKCEARFIELKVQYKQMCDGKDELMDFTSEYEAKIKQEYMELEKKLINWS